MNDKTRQIIEGLKIFQKYKHELQGAINDRIFITVNEKIKPEDHIRLVSVLNWENNSSYKNEWSIFV
jgi:hypothetical protein